MRTVRESYAARLENFSDAELVAAEGMARDSLRAMTASVQERTGLPFDQWLLSAVEDKSPQELAATAQWLNRLAAWLVADLSAGTPRAVRIAGLAAFLEWETEVQRQHAVLH